MWWNDWKGPILTSEQWGRSNWPIRSSQSAFTEIHTPSQARPFNQKTLPQSKISDKAALPLLCTNAPSPFFWCGDTLLVSFWWALVSWKFYLCVFVSKLAPQKWHSWFHRKILDIEATPFVSLKLGLLPIPNTKETQNWIKIQKVVQNMRTSFGSEMCNLWIL